jgi:hypothetical protein
LFLGVKAALPASDPVENALNFAALWWKIVLRSLVGGL